MNGTNPLLLLLVFGPWACFGDSNEGRSAHDDDDSDVDHSTGPRQDDDDDNGITRFDGFTKTRGAFSADEPPAILIVDRLGADPDDGNEASGRGTLAWAVAQSKPRVILFEVSGTIDMRSADSILAIQTPYVTIAGQTAPSPGVTVRGISTRVQQTHDVVMQHLRFRLGVDYAANTGDCLHVHASDDVVLDHLSLSWSTDELSGHIGDGDNNRRITWTNNLLTEPLASGHPDGESDHNYAMIGYYVDELSFGRNLIAYSRDRNPMIRSGRSLLFNNLAFNERKAGVSYSPHRSGEMDVILSCFIGNAVWTYDDNIMAQSAGRVYEEVSLDSRIYAADNLCEACAEATSVPETFYPYADGGGTFDVELLEQFFVDTPPFDIDDFPIVPAADVEELVLTSAGARPADRDEVDIRVVDQVRQRTGGTIDLESDVGGFPFLAENHRDLSSVQGFPEAPFSDDDGDGASNLEEWLNAQARLVEGDSQSEAR